MASSHCVNIEWDIPSLEFSVECEAKEEHHDTKTGRQKQRKWHKPGPEAQSTIVEAVKLLQQMNEDNKRKLPDDAPLGFIPKKLRHLVEKNGEVSKQAWECALLTAVRDEIKAGNIFVQRSKRFGRFDDFFIADAKWENQRESFFTRAGLPEKAEDVPEHLTKRLNQAYDNFLIA